MYYLVSMFLLLFLLWFVDNTAKNIDQFFISTVHSHLKWIIKLISIKFQILIIIYCRGYPVSMFAHSSLSSLMEFWFYLMYSIIISITSFLIMPCRSKTEVRSGIFGGSFRNVPTVIDSAGTAILSLVFPHFSVLQCGWII